MAISGHCLCGNVTYTIEGDHLGSAICHCEFCRRSTGSAYSIVITVYRKDFKLKGDWKEFVTKADEGTFAHRVFCPNCGSPIANLPDSAPEIAYIKAGTLDEEVHNALQPQFEVFTRSKLPYVKEQYGPQYLTGPTE